MGSSVEQRVRAQAEDMSPRMDYSSWVLYSDGEIIGGVTLNVSIHSASFWAEDFEDPLTDFLAGRSYAWWIYWLINHGADILRYS